MLQCHKNINYFKEPKVSHQKQINKNIQTGWCGNKVSYLTYMHTTQRSNGYWSHWGPHGGCIVRSVAMDLLSIPMFIEQQGPQHYGRYWGLAVLSLSLLSLQYQGQWVAQASHCAFHGLCPPRVQSKDYEDDFIWHRAWETCHWEAVFN